MTNTSSSPNEMYRLWNAIGTSILTGGLGQLLLLVTGILTARILGADGRGYYALLTSFPAIAAILVEGGLPGAITYALSSPNWPSFISRRAVILLALAQTILGSALYYIFLHIYELISGWSPGTFAVWGVPAVAGTLFFRHALAICQGTSKFVALNLVRLAPLVLLAMSLTLIFLTRGHETTDVVVAWSMCTFFGGLGALFAVLPMLDNTRAANGSKTTFMQLMRFGLKLVIGSTSPFESFR